jgi:hypothetical protein
VCPQDTCTIIQFYRYLSRIKFRELQEKIYKEAIKREKKRLCIPIYYDRIN